MVRDGLGGGRRKKLREWAEWEYGQISCRECIAGSLRQYAAEKNVEITVHGGRLDRPVTIKDGTYVYDTMLPDDALQDCEACEKVELLPENVPVANCYSMLISQQQRSAMGGHRLGLRMEAAIALIDWLVRDQQLDDGSLVMRRIWILDDIYNRIQNARIDAESEKSKPPK